MVYTSPHLPSKFKCVILNIYTALQIVIPGYCVVGTVGHKVLAGQKKIELDKKTTVSLY